MLKVVRDGKITDEFLDAIEAALGMAGDQVSPSNPNVLHLIFASLEVVALVSNYYLELDILVLLFWYMLVKLIE